MAYATNEGISIYYEVEGAGPPLVLHHGFAASLDMWRRNGAVAALRDDYQLILLDARGHGQSDKPRDLAAYSRRQAAADVVSVLDDLQIDRAHFYGYSMGGLVGFCLGKFAPGRVFSLGLGGANPFPAPDDIPATEASVARFRQGMGAVLALVEAEFGRLPEGMRAEIMANDPEALVMLELASLAGHGYTMGSADLGEALAGMVMPCLLVAGERDSWAIGGAKVAAERMPDAMFVALPGVGHAEPAADFALVAPHLRAFLARVEPLSRTD
jgi:pimeloyl-ACP methyl ester carboxylesterase